MLLVFLSFILLYTLRSNIPVSAYERFPNMPFFGPELPPPAQPEESGKPDPPAYKHKPEPPPPISIVDNFPLAAAAHSAADLPPIPPWNHPPSPHILEKTPLFIGFTRNWNLLQQTVVSWITAGWPPEDIYVFENTGVMRSNELGQLSLQNPFFLNHTRLHMLGVNIVVCPTLLSFSQLQNYYLWTAIQKDYPQYFWGHMDVLVVSFEEQYPKLHTEALTTMNPTVDPNEKYEGFDSVYMGAVKALRKATSKEPDDNASDPSKPWSARFFAYDRLILVNRAAFEAVGGWDTAIPYYLTDCDMYDRLKFYGYEHNNGDDVKIGLISDTGTSLDDLLPLYRKKGKVDATYVKEKPKEEKNKKSKEEKKDTDSNKRLASSPERLGKREDKWVSEVPGLVSYEKLVRVAHEMSEYKNGREAGRNFWQVRASGGKGEPYYRDAQGFEKGIEMMTDMGRLLYAEKWGHRDCRLPAEWKAGDEWRVEHDWI